MSRVTIEISCGSPFFASVGDVALDGGGDTLNVDLPAGSHDLIWAVVGGGGGAFRATIREGARTLCSVAEWRIPAAGGWSGDLATFQV